MQEAAVAQNWFATLALLAWPFVALWLYQMRPVNQATLWTILGGYLLLPVGASIKLAEGIPQLDKISVPALAALVGCFFFARRALRFWNGFGLAEVLVLIYVISPFVTSRLNSDPAVSGAVVLPAVGSYDGLSAIVGQLLFLLPFFLGRQLLRNSAGIEEALRTLILAGLLYSLPMLFEIRMSPQLHHWLYGYYSFGFATQVRQGGFRPSVFLENGLVATFFLMTAVVAATAFWRSRTRVVQKLPPPAVTAYLGAILILCKSLGALVYGVLAIPLVRLARPRLQLRIAMILATLAVSYPLLRTADLVPINYMVEAARYRSDDRADSLQFRFDHEKEMLDRASQRIMFGWGRWGRSRIYDDWGNDISVTDGRWAITLGQFGIVGFLAEFGLLALTVFRAARALKFAETERDSIFLGALALIIAINMIDLLPNASLGPWTWLLAGALLGRAEALRGAARQLRRFDRLAGAGLGAERVASQGNSVPTPLRAAQPDPHQSLTEFRAPQQFNTKPLPSYEK